MNRSCSILTDNRAGIGSPRLPSDAVYRLCAGLGVTRFAEWRRRDAGVLFLRLRLIPSTRDVEPDPWTYESLRESLRNLARSYTFVSMDEAVSALEQGSALTRNGAALITSLGSCRPSLDLGRLAVECDVPMTLYYCPGAVAAGTYPWHYVLAFAINALSGQTIAAGGKRWLLSNSDYRRLAYNDIVAQVALLPQSDRYAYTTELTESWGAVPRPAPMITVEELGALARNKRISMGVAGFSGDSLQRLTVEKALYEIREGYALFARQVGFEPVHFEYPWGDRNAYLEEFVRNAGYKSATLGFSAVNGMNRFGTDLFRLTAQSLRPQTLARMRADAAGISKTVRPLESRLKVAGTRIWGK